MTARKTHLLILGFLLWSGALSAQPPLARPLPPRVEIQGQPGTRTLYYWVYATDTRGHTAYSDPVAVTNAPAVLSPDNAVVITPAPLEGATEYGLLTSRCNAPTQVQVTVGAPGEKTFYYWFQARNGRSVWSPLEGPVEVPRCANLPENTLTWEDTGAEYYFIYRTETPAPPVGWRACIILAAGTETRWLDRCETPEAGLIRPAGNPAEKPEGWGPYLVGMSSGEAFVDQGQKLSSLLIYDMNTTAPAFNRFMPDVQGYEPSGERGAMQLNFDHRVKSPKYSWDLLNSLSIQQRNVAGGLNVYPRNWSIEHDTAKNTYNGVDIHQFNYTPGQHSPYLTFMYNYGLGDNVFLHMAMEQWGQNRTGGDEGSEFFSLHMGRRLMVDRAKVAATAPVGSLYLKIDGSLGTVAGARGIVNLTQKYTTGQAHVESGAVAVGADTRWTPEMEGRWISFDADTTAKGIRQWYLIERYLHATRLQLLAYTYWGPHNYKGTASQDGGYMICPYTEMADGDAQTDQGLRVAPLSCTWEQGDEVEAIAGPQTTFRLGWWEMGGEFLPQDHVAGLGIAYNGDKPTSEGALITYNWGTGLETHHAAAGVTCYDTRTGLQVYKETPVIVSVIRDDPYRFELAQNQDGFVIGESGRPWVSLGVKGVAVHGQGTLKGSDRTRGLVKLNGDGQTTQFLVSFPQVFDGKPFVVASSNLPIGMGVANVTPAGFTAVFATAPPPGQENVEVTWMAQE